jgi:hypothetical protein
MESEMLKHLILSLAVSSPMTTLVAGDVQIETQSQVEHGNIPQSVLREYGLENSAALTDEEGELIRGKAGRSELQQQIRIKTGNRRKRYRKSANNSATIRRLSPGRYVVRHRNNSNFVPKGSPRYDVNLNRAIKLQ